MKKEHPGLNEIKKTEINNIRKDLEGTCFDWAIPMIKNDSKFISKNFVGTFFNLFDTKQGTRRELEKDLAEKVDQVVKEKNFDISKYNSKVYLKSDEAHERAFTLYQKMHEKFNIPYSQLLSQSYLFFNKS